MDAHARLGVRATIACHGAAQRLPPFNFPDTSAVTLKPEQEAGHTNNQDRHTDIVTMCSCSNSIRMIQTHRMVFTYRKQ